LPRSYLEKTVMSFFLLIRILSPSLLIALAKHKETQSNLTEVYVVARFSFLGVLLFFASPSCWYAVLIGYLLVEIYNYPLCMIFVERYSPEPPRSINRVLIFLIINYFAMILGFAALFLWAGSIRSATGPLSGPADALYFSVVTITTVGYGDFFPSDPMGKFLVSFEAIAGTLFIVLVLASFIGSHTNTSSDTKIR